MQELIRITADAQGASTVSARELHYFLEVKERFLEWFRRRVDKYGLVENQDYVLVTDFSATNNPKNPTVEVTNYALTLDCAKELAMVQNNEKGKEARQYFIDCERIAKAKLAFPPADFTQVLTILAQQNQLLMQYNERLVRLESQPPVKTKLLPENTLESKIIQQYYAMPTGKDDARFLSATQIQTGLELITGKTLGLKRIGQALQQAGFACQIRKEKGHMKRGYWVASKKV